jgi:hypothetical protein
MRGMVERGNRMLARILKPLTSPAAGPAATLIALALAAVLALTSFQQARDRAALQGQLADANRRAGAAGVYWKARFSACEAAVGQQGPRDGAVTKVAQGPTGEIAARLVSQGPAGFDVCARMEAADQAVLSSLR